MYGGKPAVARHLRPDVRRFGERGKPFADRTAPCFCLSAGSRLADRAPLHLSGAAARARVPLRRQAGAPRITPLRPIGSVH